MVVGIWQVVLKASTVLSTLKNCSVRSLVKLASTHRRSAVSPTLPSPLLDLLQQPRQEISLSAAFISVSVLAEELVAVVILIT